jgi:F0F1-type ATP synthase alpha subunit
MLTELLNQNRFTPMPIENQFVLLYSGMKGFLTGINNKLIRSFETNTLSTVNNYKLFKSNVILLSDNDYYKKKNNNNLVAFFLSFSKFINTKLFSFAK